MIIDQRRIGEAAPKTPLFYYHIPGFSGVSLPMAEFLQVVRFATGVPNFPLKTIKAIITTVSSGRRQIHPNSCRDQILKRRLWRTCSDARCEESQGQGFQDLPWYFGQHHHHQVHALEDFLSRKWRNFHCGAWLWNWFSCWQHLQLYAPGCSSLKWEAFSGLFECLQVFQRLQELHSKGDIKEVICENKTRLR